MKKLIGALALTALIAASAFAEVSFGAWICNLYTPVAYNGDTVQSGGLSNPWGGARTARLNVGWISDDGKAGMNADYYIEGGTSVSVGDQANIWLRPVEAFKISAGKLDNYANERGDLCYGSWNWLRPSAWLVDDEGLTFSAVGGFGVGLDIYPIDGLHIWAGMPTTAGAMQKVTTAFGNSHIGASFKIGDFAKIKAQFLGQYSATNVKAKYAQDAIAANKYYTTDKYGVSTVAADYAAAVEAVDKGDAVSYGYSGNDGIKAVTAADAFDYKRYGTIEAAFDLIGIDKLFVTLGGAFTIADKEYWTLAEDDDGNAINSGYLVKDAKGKAVNGWYLAPMAKVALGASYGITESLKLSLSTAALFFHSDTNIDPVIQVGAGVDFGVTEKLAIAADFRALIPTSSGVDPTLAFMLGGTYAIGSSGSLGIGFQAIVNSSKTGNLGGGTVVLSKYDATDKVTLENGSFGFAVPIRMQIAF